MNYHQILENIYMDIRPYAQVGKQADYIPALASVDPDQFGICNNTLQGDEYALGQADTRFSIQSISLASRKRNGRVAYKFQFSKQEQI